VKPDCFVGGVGAGYQLALHHVSSRRRLTLVAPIDEVAVDEADIPGDGTESRIVEGGGVVGVGHEYDRESSQSVHVLQVFAHLVEHDRRRGVVGVPQTPRRCLFDVSEDVDEDD